MTTLQEYVGKKAPHFALPDQDGVVRSLADYKGKIVLIFFYPKDMTSGCTVEAEGFRDQLDDFEGSNVAVLGVSIDSVESHKKFEVGSDLNFPLLADTEKKVVEAYGVWQEKSMYGRKYMGIARTSFLIDREGKVVKVYESVKPAGHPAQVLADVAALGM